MRRCGWHSTNRPTRPELVRQAKRRIDLSAVIVTGNTSGLTCEAIKSVFQSRDTLQKEVSVVDNGSTDSTPEVVRGEFPHVRYLRSEQNLGFAQANNLGTAAVTGEFLLLLNSDARVKPDAL